MRLAAEAKSPSLLATVIHVEGSAYRKAGSMMWMDQKGNMEGMISAGCLEEDLYMRSHDFFKDQLYDSMVYDMHSEDDFGWGRGAGCNGRIHILIERLTPVYQTFLLELLERIKTESVLFVRQWKNEAIHRAYLTENQQTGGDCLLAESLSYPAGKIHVFKPLHILEDLPEGGSFTQLLWPQPHLIVFGAGQDMVPLVTLAAQCDFCVTIVDPRETFCNKERFPLAHACIATSYDSFIQSHKFSSFEAALIMTHQFEADRDLLHPLLQQPLFYLAVLGNIKRTCRLIGETKWPSLLHTPAGLNIGSEGPEEIAVSILAELIKSIRQPK